MYFAKQLKEELVGMHLAGFTNPTPDQLVITAIKESDVTDGNVSLLPLPPSAEKAVLDAITDESVVRSMSSITVPNTTSTGWSAEILIVRPGGVVAPVQDGE